MTTEEILEKLKELYIKEFEYKAKLKSIEYELNEYLLKLKNIYK